MIINQVDTDKLVNFEYVVNLIDEQMHAVMETDPEFYSQYNFEIANEQCYVPDEEREPNKIFIVIKFSPAQIDFGQDVMPLTIQAVSECNGLIAAQRLLFEYAQIFNLNTLMQDDMTIYQNYTSPNVISNFEVIYEGFRSVLIMSGTFLLSSNINRITLKYFDGDYAALDFPSVVADSLPETTYLGDEYVLYNNNIYKWNDNIYDDDSQTYYEGYEVFNLTSKITRDVGLNDEPVEIDMFSLNGTEYVYIWDNKLGKYVKSDGEEVDVLNFTDTFDASPNTQPYFNNKNFTDSIVKYGTYSFNISSFLTKGNLNDKVLRIMARKKNNNNNFYFKIYFDNEINMPLLKYKLINCTRQQNKGEMPSIVLAFTN